MIDDCNNHDDDNMFDDVDSVWFLPSWWLWWQHVWWCWSKCLVFTCPLPLEWLEGTSLDSSHPERDPGIIKMRMRMRMWMNAKINMRIPPGRLKNRENEYWMWRLVQERTLRYNLMIWMKTIMKTRVRIMPEGSVVLRKCRCDHCYKGSSCHSPAGCPETLNKLDFEIV